MGKVQTPIERVLVTGGAGFIGSHFIDRCLAEGCRVTAIDDLSTGHLGNLQSALKHPDFRFVQGKVSEQADLGRWISESDRVVHLAAAVGVDLVVKSPIRTIETNLQETKALLDANDSRTPVLLASTSEVYGKSGKEAFSEEDDLLIGPPRLARWSYACSKLMDEFLGMAHSRERGVPLLITRFFNTVGPRQTGAYGMVLPRFIESALAGKPIRVFGSGSQTRCFCYVADAVEAMIRLMRCADAWGEVVNIGSNEEISIERLALRVTELLGSASSLEKTPYSEAYAPGFEDMQRRKPVLEKLRRLTGFQPATTLDEIIRKTAASLRHGA